MHSITRANPLHSTTTANLLHSTNRKNPKYLVLQTLQKKKRKEKEEEGPSVPKLIKLGHQDLRRVNWQITPILT